MFEKLLKPSPWGAAFSTPIIDVAPGAEENPLAGPIAQIVRENLLSKPHKQSDFRALRGPVLLVALDAGESATLRFDHGRLTVHDGPVGIPIVTLSGSLKTLLGLRTLPVSRLGLPSLSSGTGRFGGSPLASLLSNGSLTIYGGASHPRMALRLLRILSEEG